MFLVQTLDHGILNRDFKKLTYAHNKLVLNFLNALYKT